MFKGIKAVNWMHFDIQALRLSGHLFSASGWGMRTLQQMQHLHPASEAESRSVLLSADEGNY